MSLTKCSVIRNSKDPNHLLTMNLENLNEIKII